MAKGLVCRSEQNVRIHIPIDIRRWLGIEPGDRLGFNAEEGALEAALIRHTKKGFKCRGHQELKRVMPGMFLCKACLKELLEDE